MRQVWKHWNGRACPQRSGGLGNRNGVLLANHGVLCTGKDLAMAFGNCEFLEASAITYCFANIIGKPVVLDHEIVEKEAADLARRYGQR